MLSYKKLCFIDCKGTAVVSRKAEFFKCSISQVIFITCVLPALLFKIMFIFSFEVNTDSSKFSKKRISYSYKGCI